MAIYSNSQSEVIQEHLPLKLANKQNFIILLVILFAAWAQIILLPKINNDTAFQISQVQSFLKGKGFSISNVFANDISIIEYSTNGDFAPGYLWLAAPLMQVFSIKTSVAIIDVISITIFCLSYFAIAKLLVPYTHKLFLPVNLLMVVVLPTLFEFCAATDLLSLAFYLLTLYILLHTILSIETIKTYRLIYLTIGLSFCCFLTCFFRYAYYPFLAVPLFVLLVTSIVYNRKLYKVGFLYIFIISSLLVLQLSFQGGDAYIKSRHSNSDLTQIHWGNLKQFDNFILNAFINESFFTTLLNKIGISTGLAIVLQASITAGFSIVLIWGTINILRFLKIYNKFSKSIVITPLTLFYFIGIVTISVNILFLVALSLRYELYDWTPQIKWTYVQETRYYSPTMIFILLFTLVILFYKKSVLPLFLKLFLIVFVSGSFAANALYQPLRIFSLYIKNKESDQIVLAQLPDLINKYKDLPTVIVSSDGSSNYTDYARMSGAAFCDARILLDSNVKASSPIHLFIAIAEKSYYPELDNKLKEFIATRRAAKITDVKAYGNTEIYYLKYAKQ
jgi:hypothetical protein